MVEMWIGMTGISILMLVSSPSQKRRDEMKERKCSDSTLCFFSRACIKKRFCKIS